MICDHKLVVDLLLYLQLGDKIGLSRTMWQLRFSRDDKAWANFVQLPYELLLYCVLLLSKPLVSIPRILGNLFTMLNG